jgi:pimeloyl-ACP methyl ester carboxylesterase
MPILRLDDVELFYEERGSGPPLVFLHGLGSSTRDWEPQLAHFSRRRRCVAFDIPGCGRSRDLRHPNGPFSLAGFARALAAGARELGLAPADVVGLSLGGMTGLQLALDAPDVVRSLTVVNATASLVPTTLRERLLLAVRSAVTHTLGPPGVARLVVRRLFPKPGQAALRETFVRQMAQNDPRAYLAVSRALLGWSVEDRVASLRCPVLLVASEGDYTPVARKEALARLIPGASVVVVPDSHHALPVERPEVFNALSLPLAPV